MTAKTQADWEAIERDYRAGIKTLRQIADEHGITHGSVNKRAKRDGWVRDLSAKIKARADDLVSREAVSTEVSKESKAAERIVVEANAEMQAGLIRTQRRDITRARALAMKLLTELEQQTNNLDLYEQLAELLASPDDKGVDKLGELYRKVISTPGRVKTMKELADTLKSLIGLEREAFGIDKGDASADDFVSAIKRLRGLD